MKIKFKKKRLLANLVLGLVWIGFGVFNVWEAETNHWSDYGYLVIGIVYLAYYLYELTNPYLTIVNGTIQKNGLYAFRKKLKLNDINWIKKFAGDYTLKTEQEVLKINTDLIDNDSLSELNTILAELNLSADKTPFANTIP